MDRDIYNSAKILSEPARLRVFFTISFPLALRAITTGTMMTWARAMGEFGATLMFAGNLPGVTQTMPLAIYVLLRLRASHGSHVIHHFNRHIFSRFLISLSRLLEQNRLGAKK